MVKINNPAQEIESFFDGKSEFSFDQLAIAVYDYQYRNNDLYRSYVDMICNAPLSVKTIADIPFLPILFFKTHQVMTGQWDPVQVFSSSGTTGQQTSKHLIRDIIWYRKVALKGFEQAGFNPGEWAILALLPGYLERPDASLVDMVRGFIQSNLYGVGGFYKQNFQQLATDLVSLINKGHKCLVLGVSHALLDLAESEWNIVQSLEFEIMETGGMKGRRDEITRDELHSTLCKAFHKHHIHSEYGMTELLSQAYSSQTGRFMPSSLMRILPRNITDPLKSGPLGGHAALNIIDLANVETCAFIASDDLGMVYEDGTFEVLGRLDNSDIRGCNLMYTG